MTTRGYTRITIRNYHHMEHSSHKHRAIEVLFYEHYQIITVFIVHVKLNIDKAMKIAFSTSKGANWVCIKKMELRNRYKSYRKCDCNCHK